MNHTTPMTALMPSAAIREIERQAIATLPAGELMRRAADGVARQAAAMAAHHPRGQAIEVLVGSGNNGGDALLAAMVLHERGFTVNCHAVSAAPPQAADALAVHQRWMAQGGRFAAAGNLARALSQAAPSRAAADQVARAQRLPGQARSGVAPLVIDGLYGIGLSRPLAGLAAEMVSIVNASGAPVLAVDVPSGLDAERGSVIGGPAALAIRARFTLTFIADKPGLHTGAGSDLVGQVRVDALGLSPLSPQPIGAAGERLTRETVAALITPRAATAHKGSFGGVLVLGGAPGLMGAAYLAALAAHASGAGKVWMACPQTNAFDPTYPQLMTRAFEAPAQPGDTVVIGCGLGNSVAARTRLRQVIEGDNPCVLDADALNLLASEPALLDRLKTRTAGTTLTPHPLEAARLLGCDTASIQADRISGARDLVARSGAIVVLKGAGTVLAAPDGRWAINTSGSPALATGGTGDVLAGLIGGLLAQHCPLWAAACLGVWMHGNAGDQWHARHPQGAGLNPLRLIDHIASAWPYAQKEPHESY